MAIQRSARNVIEAALRKIGVIAGDTPVNGHMINAGLDTLQVMIDSWNSSDLMRRYDVLRRFPLETNKNVYTYGPGLDLDAIAPIRVQSADLENAGGTRVRGLRITASLKEWRQLQPYGLVTALPTVGFYSESEPRQFFLDTNPDQAYVLVLVVTEPIPVPQDLEATMEVGDGVIQAMIYALAERMLPDYGIGLRDGVAVMVTREAEKLLAVVRARNVRLARPEPSYPYSTNGLGRSRSIESF